MKIKLFEFDTTKNFIPPRKIDPPNNFHPHKSDELSKKFPLCCDFHKGTFQWLDDRYKSGTWITDKEKQRYKNWFKKEIYDGMPMKIVQQVSYTEFIISEKINTNNWYKVITDYIDYNIHSFGNPDFFSRAYLFFLVHYIKEVAHFPDEKKKNQLWQYTNGKLKGRSANENKETPVKIEVVQDTIRKWIKFFPFEIDRFKNLKRFFVNQGIIITEISDENVFDGSVKIKTITKTELSEWLLSATKKLLADVDQMEIIQQKDEAKFYNYSLVIQSKYHYFKQQELLSDIKAFPDYVSLIAEWLNEEKSFLEHLKTELKKGNLILNSNIKTFSTDYSDNQLETLRNSLVEQQFIKPISQKNFNYIFQCKPLKERKSKIIWIKPLTQAHYFFRGFIFQNKEMNYPLINACFSFPGKRKLDSNYKKGGYLQIDNVFKGL